MTEEHPWMNLPILENSTVSMLIVLINTKKITPKGLYIFLHLSDVYLLAEQLRQVQNSCPELYSDYKSWYQYDHAMCCRVVDRWNLTPRYGAEGYYYCTQEYVKTKSEPPYGWEPMTRQLDDSLFL
jgi:hypothetical protein